MRSQETGRLRPRATPPESRGGPGLSVTGVWKSYEELVVLRGVDLEVERGGVAAVSGPSGCGKTTLLRVIAGEADLDAGVIRVGGTVVADPTTDVPADRRPVAGVPQGGGLLDDRNVGANLALVLPRRVRSSRKGARQVADMLDLVGLATSMADRRASQLSIGERQRVALGRALIRQPAVLLLDEPFFAFDPGTRARFRDDLHRLLGETDTATVVVSHDAADLVGLADRHYRLVAGRLEPAD